MYLMDTLRSDMKRCGIIWLNELRLHMFRLVFVRYGK